MEIKRKYFPEIISDNDEVYFARLKGIIESIDDLSSLQITCTGNSYHFRIAPSAPKYNEMILKEILNFHNVYRMHLDMSKSMKTTGTIAFTINL